MRTFKMPRMLLAALAVLAGAAVPAPAADADAPAASLKVGDPAPALDVGKWVQGEPVKQIEKGKIYVVEFWATWCGPCRATIPHLNELSKKYPDVTFVGADVWERDESKVEPFIKEMGEKMTYRVALDNKAKDKEGAMAATWMKAAGQGGIPTAFIVDKEARVAWVGHPASMDQPLEKIVAGTYDLKAEAAKAAAEKQVNAAVQAKVVGPMRQGKHDEALAAADAIAKDHPEFKGRLAGVRLSILLQKKDMDKAYAAMDEMAAADDVAPMQLNQMAWFVLTAPPFAEKRDADRALKWAQQAVDASKGKDPQVIDTLARAHAVKGEWDKAVEHQQKAVGLADGELKAELQKTLAAYKEKRVPNAEE
jgi:thiol-disulfide isomerase/thioredoxin